MFTSLSGVPAAAQLGGEPAVLVAGTFTNRIGYTNTPASGGPVGTLTPDVVLGATNSGLTTITSPTGFVEFVAVEPEDLWSVITLEGVFVGGQNKQTWDRVADGFVYQANLSGQSRWSANNLVLGDVMIDGNTYDIVFFD